MDNALCATVPREEMHSLFFFLIPNRKRYSSSTVYITFFYYLIMPVFSLLLEILDNNLFW
jgi:hypothetical protein